MKIATEWYLKMAEKENNLRQKKAIKFFLYGQSSR